MIKLYLKQAWTLIKQNKLFTSIYVVGTGLLWGIERSGFFNGREKWAKGFENQRV